MKAYTNLSRPIPPSQPNTHARNPSWMVPKDGAGFGHTISKRLWRVKIKVHTPNGFKCLTFPVVRDTIEEVKGLAETVGSSVQNAKKVEIIEMKEIIREVE